jgi:ubiquinone/menaquinone biosynthesis C-methylase UbiE
MLGFIVSTVRTHRWIVDEEANTACWSGLKDHTLKVRKSRPIKVLDLGGGTGDFARAVCRADPGNFVVSIDLSHEALRMAEEGINPVFGNILRMPFKDGSFDGVLGRAILHHIPTELDSGLSEICRILNPGGTLVIQEPCNGNIFANLARKLFTTDIHEEGEEPLDQRILLEAASKRFEISEVVHHFFFSYLMPHVTARFKAIRRSLVSLTKLLVEVDKRLMSYDFFRKRSAYVTVIGTRANVCQ